ncbi:Ribulose-1,5 bisphosphate carboxylase/oxygenase large subunit N-methyltransferase [Morus notabilis]|uniref:Ribulose-1,5 bisphosphate carboxylase/oxygenase large subunit N-methyltransferase n=1 Tax=Morus notabilis TaxID=981085 RepID=W9RDG6_9ROSA|nr:protein PLASTID TRANSCRIPTIONALLY ACTIVE 14 isoform X2 [Morus notabilis]EXB83262.1 Ribulose-1,5 bisphosphate carboxylase/oxygenase large subunit N-methyltransferase [Morus notabilis]
MAMASSSVSHCLISNPSLQLKKKGFLGHGWPGGRPTYSFSDDSNSNSKNSKNSGIRPMKINATAQAPPFPLLQPPKVEDSPSEWEPADPDFYKIGYVRSMRAYGVEFKEGPDGFGVYASKDVEPLRRARVIMEIPLELMLTISQKLPWMFFPDIIPVGHPIFDIINSTNPETDWDLRLACLFLFAFDREGNFWQLYGDFLPGADECTSLLLASEEELLELQDANLASTIRGQQRRALEFWEKNWHNGVPLKIKRLARDPERFIWAVSIAQSRCINMQMRIGALVQDANMLIPYADMLNHSFQPNCFFHWRFKDRMLEVMINAGQRIKKGDEMTVNYMSGLQNNMLMQRYGFSSPVNPWDVINFSGNVRIHLDSFLSVFNISGLPEEYYHNSELSNDGDTFVDGAVIAAARRLPTWSDGDVPPIPSVERRAVKELQEECKQMLAEFPTTSKQDQNTLDSSPEASRTLEAAMRYRLHRKLLIEKVMQALDIYQERILF